MFKAYTINMDFISFALSLLRSSITSISVMCEARREWDGDKNNKTNIATSRECLLINSAILGRDDFFCLHLSSFASHNLNIERATTKYRLMILTNGPSLRVALSTVNLNLCVNIFILNEWNNFRIVNFLRFRLIWFFFRRWKSFISDYINWLCADSPWRQKELRYGGEQLHSEFMHHLVRLNSVSLLRHRRKKRVVILCLGWKQK